MVFALLPAGASAQVTGGMTVRIRSLGNRTASEIDSTGIVNTPVGIAECDEDAALEIEVSMINTSQTVLDFWRGNGVNCNEETFRDGEGQDDCVSLTPSGGTIQIDNASQIIRLPISDLAPCGSTQTVSFDVFILAASSQQFRGSVQAGDFTSFDLAFDTEPPSAPAGVSPTALGDTEIEITWDQPSNPRLLEHHQVYVDTSAASCAESALEGLEVSVAGLEPIKSVENEANSVTLSGSKDLMLDFDQERAVYITAVDNATNESVLSSQACARRVETVGFCDEADCPDGCSAAGRVAPAALGLLVAPLAVVVRRRRLRSRRP